MQLRAVKEPLRLVELPVPKPAGGQVLIRVSVCAVCRTDLHIVNGELSEPKLPLVMGHMIVGRAEAAGEGAQRLDRKSTRLNSSHLTQSRMPSSA